MQASSMNGKLHVQEILINKSTNNIADQQIDQRRYSVIPIYPHAQTHWNVVLWMALVGKASFTATFLLLFIIGDSLGFIKMHHSLRSLQRKKSGKCVEGN